MTSGKIAIDGVGIAYSLEGPADAPAVVLSHSLMADRSMWDPQIPALSGYRVLRFDTRGHGASDAPEGAYSLEALADDAVGLMRALGIARAHWVGLSMGGMIGQTVALRHPEVLRSLVLADTSSGYPAEARGTWSERIEAARAGGVAPLVEATIDRWFSPGFRERAPGEIEKVRTMIRRTPTAGYVGCCHAIAALDITPRLGSIGVPTLIIVGEDDPGTPVAMSRVMHEGIRGSELVILPGCRHLANIEDPAAFNAALAAFLGAH